MNISTKGALRLLLVIPAALALLAAGCGGETTDVSEGVADLNGELAAIGVQMQCPDEVDGGEGTTFDCTLEQVEGEASETVELRIEIEDGEHVIAPSDEDAFFQSVETLTLDSPGGQGGGQE